MPPTGDSANNEQTLLRHYSDADPFDPMSIGGGDQFDDLLDSFLYSLRLPAKCMPLLEIAASGEKSSGSRVNQTMSAGKWTFIATQAYMSPFDEMSTNFQVDRAFLSEDDPVDLVLEIMEYHSGNLVVKFLDRHEQSVMDDYCWSQPTNVPFNTTLVYGLPTKVAAVVTWTQGDEEATADAEPKGFLAKIHAKPATTPMPFQRMPQKLIVLLLLGIVSTTFAIRCYEDVNTKDKFTSSGERCSELCLKKWKQDVPPKDERYEWDCGCSSDQSTPIVYTCLEEGIHHDVAGGQTYLVRCCKGDFCNTDK
ncbi:unnamed protein product, partial [Mesorhabditis belari]|uniref:Uncharacterized protein n=1 Tax=Mesorhabditis belari TaxID=2138241 RepID=A0AAF3ESL0_9BILA